ncbi:MAG: hypothetical protein COA42_12390 [Alteromonadaceae bacterium]|nr:MAG: hypothetical protein COA42_12390 [Alteromonadaceae bacterium]
MRFKECDLLLCYAIALLLTLTSHSVFAQAPLEKPQFRFKAIQNETLDSIGEVRAITQDKLGFMWFAGPNGLARYDGYNIKLYLHKPGAASLSSNATNDLMIGKDGTLWVATYWGLNQYDPVKDQFKRFLTDSNNPKSLSNNSVMTLLQSQDGYLWVGTAGGGLNRYDLATNEFKRYLHQPDVPTSIASDMITDLYEDPQGFIWVGTKDQGLDRFNPKIANIEFQHYRHDPSDHRSISDNRVTKIQGGPPNQLWVATLHELNRYDSSSNGFIHYSEDRDNENALNTSIIHNIYLDKQYGLWVPGNPKGMHLYQAQSDGFLRFSNQEINLRASRATAMFSDSAGGLWVAHKRSGVSKIDRYAVAFNNYSNIPGELNSLSHSDVLSIAEDDKSNLWVGTSDGLNYINRSTNKITRYALSDNGLQSNAITALLVDNDNQVDGEGNLWIGMPWRGISRLGLSSGKFSHYIPDQNKHTGLKNSEIWTLYKDFDNHIWAGSNKGFLHRYLPEKDQFTAIRIAPPNKTHPARILSLFEDDLGELWVGSDDGLFALSGSSSNKYIKYFPQDGEHAINLNVPALRAISQDSAGNMWFGTEGGGVNKWDRRHNEFKVYQSSDGLAHDTVVGIIEDNHNKIWLSTSRGLSRFNPLTETFQTYSKRHGLPANLFNASVYLKTTSDELVFGGVGGISIFKPENIFENKRPPTIALTDFQIFNKPVGIERNENSEKSPLKQTITYTKAITLRHDQSVFSFYFSALNYDIPEMNQYAYKMEGFDENWSYVGTRRFATYTNLNPGSYTFLAKASNNEGVWNEQPIVIDIIILPPWWLTWWARIIYFLLLAILFALIIYTRLQKKAAAGERQVNQKLRDLDRLKDDFLASTSHELRTPLSGVIGLSESIINDPDSDLPQQAKDDLKLIINSSKRLAYLVDDILDFSKLQKHSITLNRKNLDMHTLADNVFKIAQPLIETKPIVLVNKVPPSLKPIFADEHRIQQMMYNLVANAIKFTQKGQVCITTQIQNDRLWIEVTDTGIGIADHKLENIFTPFEQFEGLGDDHLEARHYGGTGLGLAVSKQLVELHEGLIEVNSVEGEGTTVRFSISPKDHEDQSQADAPPKAETSTQYEPASSNTSVDDSTSITNVAAGAPQMSLAPSDKNTEDKAIIKLFANTAPVIDRPKQKPEKTELHLPNTPSNTTNITTNTKETYHILIVDDEPINRKVLQNFLSFTDYKISACASGLQAIKLLKPETGAPSENIDLVLLDVMMPEINGYQVCRILRETYSENELPIVFLSAKSQISDLEAGYNSGGNDFLRKPVAKEELFARIRTHLQLLEVHRDIKNQIISRTQKLERSYNNLKQTQDQLVQAEKMSSLGTLVASVGQEIGSPSNSASSAVTHIEEELQGLKKQLNSISGDNDEDLQNIKLRFEQLQYSMSNLEEGTQRISDIVTNLNAFSHYNASDKPTEDSQTQAASIAQNLVSTMELVKANYNNLIEFECNIIDNPELYCNVSELTQVFMNIIINACQAMTILDTEAPKEECKVNAKLCITMEQVHTDLAGDAVRITFEDNGCGMTQETANRIFEPFFTTKPSSKNIGLGMSISFGIIDRHQGRFEVKSKLDLGTAISLFLPLH